ncbi:hypothetical protein [Amycolatopsis sp. PS_44_ISF1]|uniref:hypothetical protein n=1 Tax=Amycolatopsis sp. PS_44_ISF1 TaxID=2974917 RepID=UPI0028DFF88F|nr:hypothetical protein [Amycolatopsis sp. PS_44_ISF1]MDT8910905.1 hypothetical protein [Amycolatopsis sp. PS_44_ISF1]
MAAASPRPRTKDARQPDFRPTTDVPRLDQLSARTLARRCRGAPTAARRPLD